MSALRHIAFAFAALFLLMQGLSAAHMAEFGSSHDHDDVACSVAVFAEDESQAIIPTVSAHNDWAETPDIIRGFALAKAPHVAPTSRAPPPRAPPL